jgi:membrane protein YdbS with pleckstrin-like domain
VFDPGSCAGSDFDLAIESCFALKLANLVEEGGEIMKLCFCRFLLAAAVVVLAIFWWPATWAKWVILAAAAILAIMGLFYQTCCCRSMKKAEPGADKT